MFSIQHLVESPALKTVALVTKLAKIITEVSVESMSWWCRPCLWDLPPQRSSVQGAWHYQQQRSLQRVEPVKGTKWVWWQQPGFPCWPEYLVWEEVECRHRQAFLQAHSLFRYGWLSVKGKGVRERWHCACCLSLLRSEGQVSVLDTLQKTSLENWGVFLFGTRDLLWTHPHTEC